MKSSTFARSFELAKMAAKIGIKEARSGNLVSRMEQAVILADGLSKLKGAAMKAGQLLSLELVEYFPKEAVEVLSRLQSSATELEYPLIEKIIRRELGEENFARLVSIDPIPIGSASIGQVHRATFEGRKIVLKVQYPGVDESIDSDLQILKTVAKAFCGLTGRQMDLGPLFSEFKQMLKQEVDYMHEAKMQQRYFEHSASLKGVEGLNYVVPRIENSITTPKVLSMEWQSGVSLRRWMGLNPSNNQRRILADAVLNLYFHEFFEWGLVQTDPNQGNFLVRENGPSLDLVLLDFGATREYSREFIQQYVQLLEATALGDRAVLRDQAISFGLIDKRESPAAFEALHQVLSVAVRPFFSKDGKLLEYSPFDFSDEDHSRRSQDSARVLAAELKFSPPPHGLVFLHRKLGGVYAILKSLGVAIDVSVYWRRMIESAALKSKA
jgi:aarF domain-containing kinase